MSGESVSYGIGFDPSSEAWSCVGIWFRTYPGFATDNLHLVERVRKMASAEYVLERHKTGSDGDYDPTACYLEGLVALNILADPAAYLRGNGPHFAGKLPPEHIKRLHALADSMADQAHLTFGDRFEVYWADRIAALEHHIDWRGAEDHTTPVGSSRRFLRMAAEEIAADADTSFGNVKGID